MPSNQRLQQHDIWDSLNQQDDAQLKLQVERLELVRKKQEEEEAARQQNIKHLQKVKKVREDYKLLSELRKIATEIYEFTGRVIEIGGHFFPPLRVAISGFGAILDAIETIFLTKETFNRKAIRLTTSTISTGAGVASLVLSCNPATAPIGILLIAASSAVSTIKEGIFWYKENRDLNKAKQELASIKKNKRNDEYSLLRANAKISYFNQRRSKAKKGFIYSALSCVVTSLAMVAALAVVGVIVVNPVGLMALGITAFTIASAMTAVSLKQRFFTKSSDPVVANDAHFEVPKSQSNQNDHTDELTDQEVEKERHSVTRKSVHEATETIAHALTPNSKEAEVKLLQANIETYRNMNDIETAKTANELNTQKPRKIQQNQAVEESNMNAEQQSDSGKLPHP